MSRKGNFIGSDIFLLNTIFIRKVDQFVRENFFSFAAENFGNGN